MGIFQQKLVKYISNGKPKYKRVRFDKPVKGMDWFIDYYVSGRRVVERIGPNKAQAGIVLQKRRVAAAENRHLDINRTKKIRFYDFVDKYIEVYSKVNNRSYKDDISRSKKLKEYFGNVLLDTITLLEIEEYKNKRIEAVKGSTVNRELALLKSLYNKAIDWKYLNSNPVKGIRFFKETGRIRYLSEDEIKRLLECIDELIKPVVITGLNTGMRKGEIFNLKWDDIDLQQNILHVKKSKTGDVRSIPINNTLRKCLIELKNGNGHSNNGHVFLNLNNAPYKDIRKLFFKALERANIKNFKFHDIRHTAASHMTMNGVDLKTLKDLLGHKRIETTIKYAHLSPLHGRKAIMVLDSVMPGNGAV
ncbi:MAG: site-specific integrase [Elusimicrobiota bacterium]